MRFIVFLFIMQLGESIFEKISSVTSFVLSLIIISMLSLLKYITCPSSVSLEEIKLIAIVN